MPIQKPGLHRRWMWWSVLVCAAVVAATAFFCLTMGNSGREAARAADQPKRGAALAVSVVIPLKGALQRTTTQPGSIQAFESVDLYAKVAGFLKKQNVDIGDRVTRGQVLAIVDVPELEKQVQRNKAAVEQANSKVVQMQAHVAAATAELEAAKASVLQAQASDKSAAAWVRFRSKQLDRMKDLYALKSIDQRLVDESQESFEASVETEQAAKETINTARERVGAGVAKVHQAEADVVETQSEVMVAQAELERAEVMVQYATIVAPFDGVVTRRTLFPGDFVRAASEGNSVPLLTVERTDLMRVVVQVPDRDVPFTDAGDDAEVEIDALPGRKIGAHVSRTASSEDTQTRLMRVEIDLPNPTSKIRQGMYGRVTIILDRSTDRYSIPSACLVGKSGDGTGSVFVVRDGHAKLVPVQLARDSGVRVAVVSGLNGEDEVVLQPGNALREGAAVTATLVNEKGTR